MNPLWFYSTCKWSPWTKAHWPMYPWLMNPWLMAPGRQPPADAPPCQWPHGRCPPCQWPPADGLITMFAQLLNSELYIYKNFRLHLRIKNLSFQCPNNSLQAFKTFSNKFYLNIHRFFSFFNFRIWIWREQSSDEISPAFNRFLKRVFSPVIHAPAK